MRCVVDSIIAMNAMSLFFALMKCKQYFFVLRNRLKIKFKMSIMYV